MKRSVPLASELVRKTWSPQMIGEELPTPFTLVRHRILRPSLSQMVGNAVWLVSPWPLGPRKRGQLRSAPGDGTTIESGTAAASVLRITLPAGSALAPLSNG